MTVTFTCTSRRAESIIISNKIFHTGQILNKLALVVLIISFSCSTNKSTISRQIDTSDLPAEGLVKKSGKILINQPNGFTKIDADSTQVDSILVIAVHGYKSEGYEWVVPITELAEYFDNTYFYRYDWDICPDILAKTLADSVTNLVNNNNDLHKIIIFGHSYGGLVVTNFSSNLNLSIPVEIHTIAAPLVGYPRILDKCDLSYPKWNSNVSHNQWRTRKQQDGAYRDLDFDPQDINFDNSEIILLPETFNGVRLGHNWSVTWVINKYLNN